MAADIVLYHDDNQWAALPVKMYTERSAPDFIPRIGSDMEQSNLDTTLQSTLTLSGGSFQPIWQDNEKAALTYGFYNSTLAALYPVIEPNFTPLWNLTTTTSPGTVGSGTSITAKAKGYNKTYFALREGSTNKLISMNHMGQASTISLPAAVSSSTCSITSLALHGNYLFLCGKESATVYIKLYRMDVSTGTWVNVSNDDGRSHVFTLRSSLYTTYLGGAIYSVTNEFTATATHTKIKDVGPGYDGDEQVTAALEYNGAAWIFKKSGVFRFDGVDVVKIFDFWGKYPTVFNGALYFVVNGWLCRFNGSLYERVQFFGYPEDIEDLTAVQDYLVIATTGTGSGFTPIQGAFDSTHLWRLWSFDGVAFNCIYEVSGIPDSGNAKAPRMVSSVKNLIVLALDDDTDEAWNLAYIDDTTRYQSVSSTVHVTTSDFTAGFENVKKAIRRIEIDVLNAGASDSLTLKYQYSRDGKTWSPIFTAGTLSSLSSEDTANYIDMQNIGSSLISIAKKFRFYVTMTTTLSQAAIRSVTVHYNVTPQHRRRASFSVPLTYSVENKGLVDSAGDLITDHNMSSDVLTPAVVRGLINELTDPVDKVLLFLPYRAKMKFAVTSSSTTTLHLQGYFPVNAGTSLSEDLTEFLAIRTGDDSWEIVRVYESGLGLTQDGGTTIFVERGVYNTTASASIAIGAEVRIAIPVSLRVLNNDLILDDTTQLLDDYGVTQITSDLMLEATEV